MRKSSKLSNQALLSHKIRTYNFQEDLSSDAEFSSQEFLSSASSSSE